jgi:hypothetical protein
MSMISLGSIRRAAIALIAIGAVLGLAALPADAAPPGAKTGAAAAFSTTTALLTGTVYTGDEPASWEFQFGTTTSYGSTTTVGTLPASNSPSNVSATLTQLLPGTTYHYRLVMLQNPSSLYAMPVLGVDRTFSTPDSTGSQGPSGVPGVATTEPVTATNTTVATLNGVVNTQNFDSVYEFDYGPTLAYGTTTKPVALKPSTTANPVSVNITGLKPGTTYHVKLLVLQGSPYVDLSTGADVSFQTLTPAQAAKYGTASLKSKTLTVRHGNNVLIVMSCRGAKGAVCHGKVSIAAGGKKCGSGSFDSSAGHTHTVRGVASSACAKLIKRARKHRLKATLTAVFTTHQTTFKSTVTLAG